MLVGAVAMTSFHSCKKDDDNSGGTVSIVGDWIQIGATEDGISTWETDYDDCEKDDITTFQSDGKYVIDEGATKCDPNDPQISDSGTYSLSSDQKQLTMDGFVFDVVKFTASEMTVSLKFGTSTFTSTFRKK